MVITAASSSDQVSVSHNSQEVSSTGLQTITMPLFLSHHGIVKLMCHLLFFDDLWFRPKLPSLPLLVKHTWNFMRERFGAFLVLSQWSKVVLSIHLSVHSIFKEALSFSVPLLHTNCAMLLTWSVTALHAKIGLSRCCWPQHEHGRGWKFASRKEYSLPSVCQSVRVTVCMSVCMYGYWRHLPRTGGYSTRSMGGSVTFCCVVWKAGRYGMTSQMALGAWDWETGLHS